MAASVAPNAVPVFWTWSQKRHGLGPRRGQRPRATCGCAAGRRGVVSPRATFSCSAGRRGVVRPASVAAVAAAAPTARGSCSAGCRGSTALTARRRSRWRRVARIIASPPRRRLYSHPQQLPMLLPIWMHAPQVSAREAARSVFCVPRGRSGGPQPRGQPDRPPLAPSAKSRRVYTSHSPNFLPACNLRSHVSSCTSHLP